MVFVVITTVGFYIQVCILESNVFLMLMFFIVSSLFALSESMNWVQHRFEGNAPSARHKHTCSTLLAQIFIFGGMEAPPVGFSDLYILDTQPEEKPVNGMSLITQYGLFTLYCRVGYSNGY